MFEDASHMPSDKLQGGGKPSTILSAQSSEEAKNHYSRRWGGGRYQCTNLVLSPSKIFSEQVSKRANGRKGAVPVCTLASRGTKVKANLKIASGRGGIGRGGHLTNSHYYTNHWYKGLKRKMGESHIILIDHHVNWPSYASAQYTRPERSYPAASLQAAIHQSYTNP